MATLEQAGRVVTERLHERVDRLVSAIEDDAPDLAELARLADGIGELADRIGELYRDVEQTLMRGLQGESGPEDGADEERQDQEDEPRSEQREPRGEQRERRSEQNGSTGEEVTKEELLGRAREVDVHGRSSMSKEELARAVEAEEAVTKEELLERAREAGVEGRSSMTKEELREALREAGA